MAVLFDEHPTAVQTEAAFRAAGHHFNKRRELRSSLPGLQFVAARACAMVCDMITAHFHRLQVVEDTRLPLRRFRPRRSKSVSILTPGFATQSMAGRAFIAVLAQAVDRMHADLETVRATP